MTVLQHEQMQACECMHDLHKPQVLAALNVMQGTRVVFGIQDYKTLYATMKRIADAEPRDLDTWNIGITAGDCRLLAPQLLPVSISSVIACRTTVAAAPLSS